MGHVEQQVFGAGNAARDTAVDFVDQLALGPGQHPIKTAERRLDRPRQRLPDADRLAVTAQSIADRVQVGERGFDRLLRGLRIAGRRAQGQAAMVDGHEHGVAPRLVDRRIGRERGLHHLVVVGLYAFQRDAVARGAGYQRGHDEVRGGVADQTDAKWREGRQRMAGVARFLDGLGQTVELVLVQRVAGQALNAVAEVRRVAGKPAALRGKLLRRRRQPREPRIEMVAPADLAWISEANSPTFFKRPTSAAENFRLNFFSTASTSRTCARLSHSSTSSAVSCGLTTMLSSSNTSWKTSFSLA